MRERHAEAEHTLFLGMGLCSGEPAGRAGARTYRELRTYSCKVCSLLTILQNNIFVNLT